MGPPGTQPHALYPQSWLGTETLGKTPQVSLLCTLSTWIRLILPFLLPLRGLEVMRWGDSHALWIELKVLPWEPPVQEAISSTLDSPICPPEMPPSPLEDRVGTWRPSLSLGPSIGLSQMLSVQFYCIFRKAVIAF